MVRTVLRVLDPGLGASLQDRGRPGWARFGVPRSGAMDEHAASWANRLLENPSDAPVAELLFQGARLEVLEDVWIALTGADAGCNIPLWRAVRVRAGDEIEFGHNRLGVWIYLAIEDGFVAEQRMGSCSVYVRGGLGAPLAAQTLLYQAQGPSFELPSGVAGRWTAPSELRDYAAPPRLRVWPGPQWDLFAPADREKFFKQAWKVTTQSDRVGYRLAGKPLVPRETQLVSEPVRVGVIQVPESGQPIVTMRDGPTVGGYPKLGVVDPADLSWLAQCRPGQQIQFQLVDEAQL